MPSQGVRRGADTENVPTPLPFGKLLIELHKAELIAILCDVGETQGWMEKMNAIVAEWAEDNKLDVIGRAGG